MSGENVADAMATDLAMAIVMDAINADAGANADTPMPFIEGIHRGYTALAVRFAKAAEAAGLLEQMADIAIEASRQAAAEALR